MSKTVFFGPFIGEFGWELLFWQGWVRKVCRTMFREHRKIASSYPGRQPFYPYVDEFWPLPDDFVNRRFSAHNYITDGWRNGFPGSSYRVRCYKFGVIPTWRWEEQPLSGTDVEILANALLESYAAKLPEDTVYFVPWRLNYFEPYDLEFGVSVADNPQSTRDFRVQRIGFEHQLLEPLEPTPAGEEVYLSLFPEDRQLIAVFPRYRTVRRSDKNWSRSKYLALIKYLQDTFPHLTIGIFGAPGGAHFVDGVPDGCLDFIHVPEEQRMDVQIAALKRAILALGGMSGAILVALAAGCPSLTWGYAGEKDRYHYENFLGTRFVYHPVLDANVDDICRLAETMIEGTIPEEPQEVWSTTRFLRRGLLRSVARILSDSSRFVALR